jgi:hypothetical protein
MLGQTALKSDAKNLGGEMPKSELLRAHPDLKLEQAIKLNPTSKMHRFSVRFILWDSGAYALSRFDEETGLGSLLEFDGRDAMHLVSVSSDHWQETVTTRRASPRGVSIFSSLLSADKAGNLEWEWSVERPRLTRSEHWKVPALGSKSWVQTDRRPGRTTVYRSGGRNRFVGQVTNKNGQSLWTTDWTYLGSGRLNGNYIDEGGNIVGRVSFEPSGKHGGGSDVSWDGPISSGTLAYGDTSTSSGSNSSDDRSMTVTTDSQGNKVTTFTDRFGSVAFGQGSDIWWVKTTENTQNGTRSLEHGEQKDPSGNTEQFTIHEETNKDGSKTWDRTGVFDNGDKSQAAGATDADGNRSWTDSTVHPDGSGRIITETTDKSGDGTVRITEYDKDGNITKDKIIDLKNGSPVAPSSPSSPGTPGSPAPSTPSTPEEPDEEPPEEPDEEPPGDPDPDPPTAPDPNDSNEPDQPDSPDSGDHGMPSDDGTDERPPHAPLGKIGSSYGDALSSLFSSIRLGDVGGTDDDESVPVPFEDGRKQLVETIRAGGGDASSWSADDNESDVAPQNIVISAQLDPPKGSDETGWGGSNDPRVLVAMAAELSAACATMGRSGNLLRGARQR